MADRYWVGGTGNWNDTNRWSTGSGGGGGASVPTTADNVFFNNASAAGTFTVTITAGSACANFDASGITDPAKKMTLTGTSAGSLSVAGSWINPTGTFYASTFNSTPITFSSTTIGNTITTNGVTFASVGNPNITFNGVGGGWTLGSAFTLSGVNAITTLTNGALDLNGFTLTTGYWVSSNSNTRSIAFGTTGSISVYTTAGGTVWSMATVTGFSYTGNSSVVMSGNTTTAHGSTAGGTEANSLNFTCSGATNGGAATNTRYRNLTFSAYSGTFTGGVIIYGDLVASSTMTFGASANPTSFSGSGTQSVTMNGKTFDQNIAINGTGTVTLVDNLGLATARLIALTSGTLNLNGQNLTTGFFSSTGSTARVINFGTNGSVTVAGAGATAWNATGSGLTTSGIGTISMTSASAKTFVGGGYTYAAALNQGGAGTLTISGSNTFQNVTNTYGATGATTITFTAGTTQTVSAFTASGASGNLLTLNSSSAGTRFNLSDSSGSVNVSFCDIKDSNATGGARWLAYLANGNVNSGNNLGWRFSQGEGLNIISGLSGTRGLSIGVGLVGNL